jgi:hypothetical protein
MKQVFLITFILVSTFSLCQNKINTTDNDLHYDLPPGNMVPSKMKIIDYSYKLEGIHEIQPQRKKFNLNDYLLKEEQAALLDENHLHHEYMVRLEKYYNDLSSRIKTAFTFEEIWHIFAYDKNMKETLLTID